MIRDGLEVVLGMDRGRFQSVSRAVWGPLGEQGGESRRRFSGLHIEPSEDLQWSRSASPGGRFGASVGRVRGVL